MAPSSLTAAVALAPSPAGDYELDEDFHWDREDLGVDYFPPPKLNKRVAPYSPLCSHVSVISSVPALALSTHLQAQQPCVSSTLQHLLKKLSLLPVVLLLNHGRIAVADTGATDHMVTDKSCFISYKSILDLSVQMGNNSNVPVLGCGLRSVSLNGKQLLCSSPGSRYGHLCSQRQTYPGMQRTACPRFGSSALQLSYPHHPAGLWIHWHQGNWILGALPYLCPLC
jgi:hypothetical protein